MKEDISEEIIEVNEDEEINEGDNAESNESMNT